MELIETVAAEGLVLAHDMTRIIPGKEKKAAFKKGHIVTKDDIPELLKMGKEHLYVWEKDDNMYHEDEAAEILCDISMGDNLHRGKVSEGKIELFSDVDGILKIEREGLCALNGLGEMMIASRHGDFPVKKGDKVCAMRVIPLVIEKEKMERAKKTAGERPLFNVVPFKNPKVSIITTGNEVYTGRIKDSFGPVLKNKAGEYGLEVLRQTIIGDDREKISAQINKDIEEGAQIVLLTGGMSVDPDDTTPSAIKLSGAKIISYGAPVLPGAMFLLAYKGDIPIMGLPGCVMYSKRTIFDLVFPRVLSGEKIDAGDLRGYGEGGLCLSCDVCTFPNCGFGKK